MAKRRMFSLDVVDTDKFLDMPASTQNLYFHLGMRADDDGFVASPRKITALVNCSADDMKLLITKGFVYIFGSGVCVIIDWKTNNFIRPDRYQKTVYEEEKKMLISSDVAYGMTHGIPNGYQTDTNGIPDDIPTVYPDKDSIGKVSIGKDSTGKSSKDSKDSNKAKGILNSVEESKAIGVTPLLPPQKPKDMIIDCGFGDALYDAMYSWVKYKHEKSQDYKPTGLKMLLTQTKKAAQEYGEEAVAEVIKNSMSSNYMGITFDRLKLGYQPKDRMSWMEEERYDDL